MDETIFPPSSTDESSDKSKFQKKTTPGPKSPPPLTYLRPGPKGSGHKIVPEWRGEPMRAKFESAAPRIHEAPPSGMGTPFRDLQQLSVFAFPKVYWSL